MGDRLNLVVAIDLSRSVAVVGPDDKSEFQKNVEGVSRLLATVPAGARATVIGITDHSFTQPYVLLRAQLPDDTGYFGERLDSARRQLTSAWMARSVKLAPQFPSTDIFGAFALASEIHTANKQMKRTALVIFSDMRESAPQIDFESRQVIPPFDALTAQCGKLPDLRGVLVFVLGVEQAGKSSEYLQSLHAFWREYLNRAGAELRTLAVLREIPQELESHGRRLRGSQLY